MYKLSENQNVRWTLQSLHLLKIYTDDYQFTYFLIERIISFYQNMSLDFVFYNIMSFPIRLYD